MKDIDIRNGVQAISGKWGGRGRMAAARYSESDGLAGWAVFFSVPGTPGLYGASTAIVNARTASLRAMIVMLPKAHSARMLGSLGAGILSSGHTDDNLRLTTSISGFCRW